MNKNKITLILIRVTAFLFCLLSAHRAIAGISIYQAERAFHLRNYEQTFRFSERGLKIHPSSPELLNLHLQSGWWRGQGGETSADSLLKLLPFWGRAWLFKAWFSTKSNLDESKWNEIKQNLQKACRFEPGSAWILFNAGRTLLEHPEHLTPEDKKQALGWIVEALRLHDSNQASSYLRPGLKILWNSFHDPEILIQATTEDIFSYDILAHFMASKKLDQEHEQILPKVEKLRKETYDAHCRKAEKLLLRGDRGRAFAEFQIASWMDNTRVYAEAGMIVSGFPKRKMPFDIQKTLVKISEDQKENWEWMKPRLKDALDAYEVKK